VGTVDDLLDVGLGLTLVWVARANVDWLPLVATSERENLGRHGRREEQGLTLWGQQRKHLLDVWKEAQVEHFIGLIENQVGNGREVDQLLLVKVQKTAGGADDDVCSLAELLDLTLIGLATVDLNNSGGAVH